jgi:hypothetical protein
MVVRPVRALGPGFPQVQLQVDPRRPCLGSNDRAFGSILIRERIWLPLMVAMRTKGPRRLHRRRGHQSGPGTTQAVYGRAVRMESARAWCSAR